MRQAILVRRLLLTVTALFTVTAHSVELSGQVVAVNDGRGVAQAMVTLTLPDGATGPKAITVFTAADGSFRIEDEALAKLDDATIEARRLGYRQMRPISGAPLLKRNEASGRYEALLYVEPVADISKDVPASAWLAEAPAGNAKNETLVGCTSCHQFPSPRVREYADKIEAVDNGPDGDKKALDGWRRVVRHESWRDIVKYMRSKHYAVFPVGSKMNLDAIDWATAQNPDYNFFNKRQGEIIARYLADHFPRSTASMARDAYGYGAPLGVTERTVIREFSFPKLALVRELVPAPRSPYLWGADVRRNLVVRLDPASGETKWYPVDFKGSTGPHTIVPDDSGKLWVSMIDNDQFGRFDPKTEKWKLWTLRPTGLADSASLGGATIVHDMSIDSKRHLARDAFGKIWLTLVGTNQMGTLDPDSGEVAFYATNQVADLSPINHLIYSTVLSADGKHVWYSQLNGSVGCIDTATKKVVALIPFPEGTGPRRMARDNSGNLWVALFGTGQVAKVDMARGKVVATFDLPDRSAAPYAVTWDERRKAVWVANANSDAIYRLDPGTKKIEVYPLPRPMGYLREIAIDSLGRLVSSYGNYPEGSGPSMGVLIDVGDEVGKDRH